MSEFCASRLFNGDFFFFTRSLKINARYDFYVSKFAIYTFLHRARIYGNKLIDVLILLSSSSLYLCCSSKIHFLWCFFFPEREQNNMLVKINNFIYIYAYIL